MKLNVNEIVFGYKNNKILTQPKYVLLLYFITKHFIYGHI